VAVDLLELRCCDLSLRGEGKWRVSGLRGGNRPELATASAGGGRRQRAMGRDSGGNGRGAMREERGELKLFVGSWEVGEARREGSVGTKMRGRRRGEAGTPSRRGAR